MKKAIREYFSEYTNFLLNGISTDLDMRGFRTLTLASKRYTPRNVKMTKLVQEEDRASIVVETSENVYFYAHDGIGQGARVAKRIMETLKAENPGKDLTLYLIQIAKNSDPAVVSRELDELAKALGNPDIFRTSDLSPVPRAPRAPRVASDTCKFAWKYEDGRMNVHSDSSMMWTKVEATAFDGDGPFFYVALDRLCPLSINKETLHHVWRALKNLRLEIETDDDVYSFDSSSVLFGLNTKGVERVRNNANWVDIFPIIKESTFSIPESYLLWKASQGMTQVTGHIPNVMHHYIQSKLRNTLRQFVKGTEFHRQAVLIRRINQIVARRTQLTPVISMWNTLLNFNGQAIPTVNISSEITRLKAALNLASLQTTYPMVAYVDQGWYRQDNDFLRNLGTYIANQDRLAEVR